MNKYVLKPCPFCGGEAILRSGLSLVPVMDGHGEYTDAEIDGYPSYVECTECGSIGQSFDNKDDNDDDRAVEAWNRRVK